MPAPARPLGVVPASHLADLTQLHSVLPIAEELRPLLPWPGLRRGITVGVTGTALLLRLAAEATTAGKSWCAAIMPGLGVLAAAELGLDTSRLALISRPPATQLVDTLVALADGFDILVIDHRVAAELTASRHRRLAARVRHRGCVLLIRGNWPGADLQLSTTTTQWQGLGQGWGYITGREVTVTATGRGAASRPRLATITFPPAQELHQARPTTDVPP